MSVARAMAVAAVLFSATPGCSRDVTSTSSDVEPEFVSANAIPRGKPAGRIAQRAFATQDALYYVNLQPGRESVTVRFSEAEEPCHPRSPQDDAASVWIRLPGSIDTLQAGERRRASGDRGGWSVHYQLKEGRRWIGRSDAAALLVITEVRTQFSLEGALSACFGDDLNSCVSGSFVARYCANPLSPDLRQLGVSPQSKPPSP